MIQWMRFFSRKVRTAPAPRERFVEQLESRQMLDGSGVPVITPGKVSAHAILTVPFGWSPIVSARVETTLWPATGNWTFTDNGAVVAEIVQDSTVENVAAGSGWARGEHNIVAHYSGDDQHEASDSDVYHFTNFGDVNITMDAPKTTLREGENAQLTVHVTSADPEGGPASGWVSFFRLDENVVAFTNQPKLYDSKTGTERPGYIVGNAALDASGSATYELEIPGGADEKIVAVYFGLDYPVHAQPFDKFRLPPVADQVPSGWNSAVTAPVEFQSFKVINLSVKAFGPGTPNHPPIIAATVTDMHGQSQAPPEFLWPSERQSGQSKASFFLQVPKAGSKRVKEGSTLLPGIGPEPTGDLHYNITGTLPTPPTGTIKFMEGKKVLGVAPINSYGTAEFRPHKLSAGTHNITAVYAGDDDFIAAEATGKISTSLQPTSTQFSPAVDSLRQGKTINVEVNVTAPPGVLARPGGWVLLTEQKNTVARLRLGRMQTLNLDLPAGMHHIRAVYMGDEDFRMSHSKGWVVRVLKAG